MHFSERTSLATYIPNGNFGFSALDPISLELVFKIFQEQIKKNGQSFEHGNFSA